MSQQKLELPKGWIKIRLGDYLNFQYGKGLTKKDRKKGNIPVYGSSGIDGYHNKSLVKTPSLVIGRKGSAGNVHLVEEPFWAIDTTYFVEETFLYDIKFLFHLLTHFSPKFIDSSTAVPSLRRDDAYAVNIPVIPLNEQKRIVSKIEELFSKIDATKQSLKQTKLQLQQYRQSLLKSTFEGKLMKKVNNKIKFVSLNEISSIITGYTPKTSNSSFYGNDIPFFKPKDLNKGYFVNNSKDKLSTKGIQKARLIPEKSVLVTSIGATIGKIGFSRIQGVTNQQINSIIPDSNQILPEFLYFLCISPQFQESILKNASSTTLPIISKSKFSKLKIPLFSIKEQQQITSQIEEDFSLIENTSKIVESTLQNLQTMKMSIFKQAFEGRLVPQDPNDEPASVLLERIKSTKESQSTKQRRTKNVK